MLSEAFAESLKDPVAYAVPFFVLFMVLELLALKYLADDHDKPRMGYQKQDSIASLSMGLVSVLINLVARSLALVGYVILFEHFSLWQLDPTDWRTWVFTLLLVDLLWYAYHRSSHRVRLLWAFHQAHHNSVYFNYTTALRQKWNPWGELLFWVPLPILGVPPWMIFFAFSINLMYQFWVHTETVPKLWAPIEFVFNTPSHHRVHHASDSKYLDRNYAGILIIWDRMFGTFAAEEERPTYGLTKPVETKNILALQYGELGNMWQDLKRAGNWRNKLGYVFRPPGWSPK